MFEVEIDTSSTQVTALRQKKKKSSLFFFSSFFFFFSSLIKYLCKRKEANIEREADSCDAIPVVYAHLRDTRRTKKKKENKEEKKKKGRGRKEAKRLSGAAALSSPLPSLFSSFAKLGHEHKQEHKGPHQQPPRVIQLHARCDVLTRGVWVQWRRRRHHPSRGLAEGVALHRRNALPRRHDVLRRLRL